MLINDVNCSVDIDYGDSRQINNQISLKSQNNVH